MCDHNLRRFDGLCTNNIKTYLLHAFVSKMDTEFIRQQVSNFPFKRRDNVLLDENGKCPDCIAVLDVDDYYGCV